MHCLKTVAALWSCAASWLARLPLTSFEMKLAGLFRFSFRRARGMWPPSIGDIRHPELACCYSCDAARRHLYHIKRGDGQAEAEAVDAVISTHMDRTESRLDGVGAARAQQMLGDAV